MLTARRAGQINALSGLARYNAVAEALSGIQYYWPLSEASGTSFADPVGGNTAAAASSPSRTTGPDGVSSAVDFNTTTNSVILPGTQFTIPSRHCIFYWMKLDAQTANDGMAVEWSTSGYADLVQHDIGCSSAPSPFSSGTAANFTYWYGNSGSTSEAEGEARGDYPNGQWVFICVNVDPTINSTDEIQVFFNCVHMGIAGSSNTHQSSSPSGNGHFSIGGRGNGGTRALPLSGAMQGVGVVNQPLTQAQMRALYKAMTGQTGIVQIASPSSPGPSTHNAFPGAALMPNENILLAWRNANGDPNTGSTTCAILAVILTPDGNGSYTPGSVTTLHTGPSGYSEADVGVIALANGNVMVTWNESNTPGTSNLSTTTLYWSIISTDNGATWGTASSQSMPGFASNASGSAGAYGIAPCAPVQIPAGQTNAGRLLLPVYGWDDKTATGSSNEYVKIMYSDNNGSTYSFLSDLWTATSNIDYDETCLSIDDQNTLHSLTRTIESTPGYDIYHNTSTSWGASWGTATRLLGSGASTGWGGRPSLAQNSDLGMLLRARYVYSGSSSATAFFTSPDRCGSLSGAIDPFTLGTTLASLPSHSSRGVDEYGAFVNVGGNNIAYAWSESPGPSGNASLYFRVLTNLPGL